MKEQSFSTREIRTSSVDEAEKAPDMKKHLLSVQDLHTSFFTESGEVQAVNGISFNLDPGEVLGIVGESGSGKSVTAYSVMRILADTGRITGGRILYKGEDLADYSEKQMQSFRGKCCSIISRTR